MLIVHVAVQDGVYLLSLEPQLIHGYTSAILTPNVVEFARLYSAVVRLLVTNLIHVTEYEVHEVFSCCHDC